MTKLKADYDEKLNKGRGGNAPSVSGDIEDSKLGETEDELLPNIPNHLVLQMIVPKLSARGINILSLVSPTWQEAIHRRWVYDERVRSHSTETFVVALACDHPKSPGFWTHKLRLYSLNDNSAYDLPPVPSREGGCGCKCIALDGKIYILGGAPGVTPSSEVFMLDLAGQREWEECASMQEGTQGWGAGILDRKIYVFGGRAGINRKSVGKPEVYDPKIDAWSSIADKGPWRSQRHAASVGEELFVYCEDSAMQNFGDQYNLVAYHSIKKEWREIVDSNRGDGDPWFDAFQAQGKIYTITQAGIDVYDIEANSWNPLHSFSGLEENSGEFASSIVETRYDGLHILPLGDEVLILRQDHSGCNSHSNRDRFDFIGYHDYRTSISKCTRLVQSRGLGTRNREFAVEEIGNCRLSFDLRNSLHFEIKCLIQL